MKRTEILFHIVLFTSMSFFNAGFSQSGSLDFNFDFDGIVTTDFGNSGDYLKSIAVQNDGKIVSAGYINNGNGTNFAITRHNTDGTLDAGFNSAGIVIIDLGAWDDHAYAVTIQDDGKIVIVGKSDYSIAVVRINADGSLDSTFDSDGIVLTDLMAFAASATDVIVQPDGKILVCGINMNATNDFALIRYNTNGTLDNTFDLDGIVTTSIGVGDDVAQSIALQSDGKIIICGYSENGSNFDFSLARYNPDGSLDNTFDSDGVLFTAISINDDKANSANIQPDGKIVVCGYSSNGLNNDIAIARYNSNGTLDTSFDFDGILTTDFSSNDEAAKDAMIQTDGKIIIIGDSYNGADTDVVLVRYTTIGVLDFSFDSDGFVIADGGFTEDDFASSGYLQSDGKIIIGGSSVVSNNPNFTLYRYNTDGTSDNTFNGNGFKATELGGSNSCNENINSIDLQYDGKIVAAGTIDFGSGDLFAVSRYNSDGSLDLTFGNEGKVVTNLSGNSDVANDIAIQTDGKILVAGFTGDYSVTNFALVRYNADGTLDFSFGTGGIVLTSITGGNDYCHSIALQGDGKILLVGTAQGGLNPNFSVVRYNSNGTLDPSFGTSGIVLTDYSPTGDLPRSIAVQNDGKIIIAGRTYNGTKNVFAILRYNSSGALDTSFDSDGILLSDIGGNNSFAYSLIVQDDGKILAGGTIYQATNDFAICRYNEDGSLDPTFGLGGITTTDINGFDDQLKSIKNQVDGKIVAAGFLNDGSDYSITLVRYNNDGSLDNTFNSNGKVNLSYGFSDLANSVLVDNSERIVVAGLTLNGTTNDFILARFMGESYVNTSDLTELPPSTIYPNPTTGELTMLLPNPINNGTIKVLNSNGQIVAIKANINGMSSDLDISSLPNGIYFIEINDGVQVHHYRINKL